MNKKIQNLDSELKKLTDVINQVLEKIDENAEEGISLQFEKTKLLAERQTKLRELSEEIKKHR